MSDPVTNVDIEDVLSSIRRLVSNGPDASGPKDKTKSDKLVLTPSLRVDETNAPDESAADEIAPGDEQAAGAEPEHPEPDDHRAEPEAVSDMAATEPATGQEAGEGLDRPERDGPEADASETDDAEIDRFLGEGTSALGAQAAEFEEEVAQREDQWEPDGVSDDAYAGGAVASVEWQDATEDDADDEFSTSSDPDMEPADEATSYSFERVWETVEDDGRRAAPGTDFDFDDAVIDEDSLRDMVAEIVRQELQGTLGERITRNVRKLVRREIHRALTSQDFE